MMSHVALERRTGLQGICDNITEILVLKSVMMGGGGVIDYGKLHFNDIFHL